MQDDGTGAHVWERLGTYAEARAVLYLDELELIDEDVDENKLIRFGVRLRAAVRNEARDLIAERYQLKERAR